METIDIMTEDMSYKLSNELLSQLYTNQGLLWKMKVQKHMTRLPTAKELIEKLAQKHHMKKSLGFNGSSSTPTVPYSSADVLYGNEIVRSNQIDDFQQSSFVDIEKDIQQKGKELDQLLGNRGPSSKNSSRRSLSLDKVPSDRDRENVTHAVTSLPSAKLPNHQFCPNGIRNVVKGDQLYSGSLKGNGTAAPVGRDADDFFAMGTLFSPNHQQQKLASMQNGISSTNSSSAHASINSLAHNASKIHSVNTTPPSSLTALTPPTRKFGYGPVGSSTRPVLTQSSSGSGMRNLWREREMKEVEPRYSDPLLSGAPASFQQRVMELGALESETVRWERNKKFKKKNKQDRDS